MKEIESSSLSRRRLVAPMITSSTSSSQSGEPSVMTSIVSLLPFAKWSRSACLSTPARSVLPSGTFSANNSFTCCALVMLGCLWNGGLEKNHTVGPSGSNWQMNGARNSTAFLASSQRFLLCAA
eukprot:TRINITY_DN159_c0_g1_i13.p3 TRINITY_DN159_c0_g1~~TRINITY_DN159_c0_g1_i13.p3  ORF type:complete len:124 (-),score=8.77 TRINITY_DN159_c0_g1_i13:630-1001(-)